MSTETDQRGRQMLKNTTVSAGANEILYLNDFVDSGTISIFPGSGATAKIEFTISNPDEIESANWITWQEVTAEASYQLVAVITAIRCSSTAGSDSVFEIAYTTTK